MSHKTVSTPEVRPEAFIAVGKDRQKIFEDKKTKIIFLNDKQEFQIELFNPNTKSVLTRISLNGVPISSRGLVLKPGERVWIERYLDDNKKFVFSTYEVESNEQVKKAISKNGVLTIEFFDEMTLPIYSSSPWWYWTHPLGWYNGGYSTYTYTPTRYPTGTTITFTGTTTPTASSTYFCSTNTTEATLGKQLDDLCNLPRAEKDAIINATLETGRVEKGAESNQKMKDADGNFNSYASHVIEYKLLPTSQKTIMFSDEIKTYCVECGRKMKTSFKFCPSCGTKAT